MSEVYWSFILDDELFAINVKKVLVVLQKQEITMVPNAPEIIVGIMNFRGDVVPVFDTRIKFNMKRRNENDNFVIAILDLIKNNEPFRIGTIVDKVSDVITIEETEIQPVPPMSSRFDTKFLSGIVKRDNRFILLLNIDNVFINNEISGTTMDQKSE
jgi:purine-binding chemotaxis protein CheW